MIGTRAVASCLHVARVLQAYLDGQVDELTARRVSRHLETCRRCRLEAAACTEIKRALGGRAEPPPAEPIGRLSEFASKLIDQPPPEEESIDSPSGA